MIPYFKQETDYTCGVACMRMILASFGIRRSERVLAKIMGSSPRFGTLNRQFPLLAEKFRLSYFVGRDASLKEIDAYLKSGFCVVVNFFDVIEQVGHYAVVKSVSKKQICLIDPFHGPGFSLSINAFLKVWKNSYEQDTRWFFAVKK